MTKQPNYTYNSAGLKARFPDIYKELFTTCTTVASAPGNILWAGNYGLLTGAPGVVQNLPLRSYAGLEETAATPGIHIASCAVFDPRTGHFFAYRINDAIQEEILKLLSITLPRVFHAPPSISLNIHILNEMPIGYGANASGAFAVALTSALALHFKKADTRILESFGTKPIHTLRVEPIFEMLLRHAWKIEVICHNGLSSGIGTFAPWIASTGPIAYSIEAQATIVEDRIIFSCDIGESGKRQFDLIDRIQYSAFRISRLNNNSEDYFFPFDFGVINSGIEGTSAVSNRALALLNNSLRETVGFFNEQVTHFFTERQFSLHQQFANKFLNHGIKQIIESFFRITEFFSINILFSLARLNQKHFSGADVDFERLIKNMNDYRSIYRILNIVPQFINKLHNLFEQYVQEFNDEHGIGLRHSGNTRGGYIIFASASRRVRTHLSQTLAKISEKLGERVSADYLSWRDGVEPRAVIVEQHLAERMYAPSICRAAFYIMRYDAMGKKQLLLTKEKLLMQRIGCDVLLDSTHDEIWIKGEKITSKEIKTAVNTIALLRILLERLGETVAQHELPSSTYTKDRNEFQSKIASPLVKAIERRLGRRISFNVSGNIIHFTVTLEPKDVIFYYIEQEL